MGRPIKKQFFGSLTKNQAKLAGGSIGVGGEGIASVAVTGSPTGKSTGTYTATIAAPAIAGGIPAAGTVTVAANGSTVTFTLTTAGSGYLTAPTITSTAANAGGSGTAVFTATLTSTRPDTLSFGSRIKGGTAQTAGDIIKQEGSRRYLIQNSDGKGICKLVTTATGSLLVGEMNLIATDYNGSTYYVTKLTGRKARLKRLNMVTAYLIKDGAQTGWNIGSSTGTIVTIANTI
jgi:hypothetical protein